MAEQDTCKFAFQMLMKEMEAKDDYPTPEDDEIMFIVRDDEEVLLWHYAAVA